jgi:hypothetical protein
MPTPRCSACRLPYTPPPGGRAKDRKCPGCRGRTKRKRAKTLSPEQRDVGERELRMMQRGRLVSGGGFGED